MGDELERGNDELKEWAKERGNTFFLKADDAIVQSFRILGDWVTDQGYSQQTCADFLRGADGWLIAHAQVFGCTAVTHERSLQSRSKIKIPDVCSGLKVRCVSPYDMLREEGAKFVLGA